LSMVVLAQRPGGGGQGRPSYNDRPAIASLKGTVLDSIAGTAMEFATISVYLANNDSLVGGGVTNSNGRFLIDKLRPGMYNIKINFIGYEIIELQRIRLMRDNMNADLGAIKLPPSAANLKEFELIKEKEYVVNNIDKKVYNIDKNLNAQGADAMEIMESIPSIQVDTEGKISYRGDANVTILIDGRPSGMTGGGRSGSLDQIPASSIDRIEIISNPSAKYDPDGISGIINVVLKKERKLGINGSVNINVGSGNKANGGFSINQRDKKTNIFLSYTNRYDERWRISESSRNFHKGDDEEKFNHDKYSNGISQSHMIRWSTIQFVHLRKFLSRCLNQHLEHRYLRWLSENILAK